MEKPFVEPGAVIHGNFINYYEFNSASERLSLLPVENSIWQCEKFQGKDSTYLVLDVGCNAGDFTQLLYEFLSEKIERRVFVLGIDIDPLLIIRANENNRHLENVSYLHLDVMQGDAALHALENHLNDFGASSFDVISCMSVTMWIHLNNGDDGLKQFLRLMSQLSELLVIEPQPWKCYQNALRRMKRAGTDDAFPLLSTLEIRHRVEDEIKELLQNECEMKLKYESDRTKWKRSICIYRKEKIKTT